VAALLATALAVLPAPAVDETRPTYINPVIDRDCPDPGVVETGVESAPYLLACTGGALPLLTSGDLIHWAGPVGVVLSDGKAPWAVDGSRDWAPEIHRVGTGWVAYFTAADAQGSLSIGAATARSDGVIDATYFEDDDASKWLVYKIDSNARGLPTKLVAQRLADDGLSLRGTPTTLLSSDASTWEGLVIEAPSIVKHDGLYYLVYSGNVYDHRYRTGVARAGRVLGPYEKKGQPILANNERWVGPGHGSIVAKGGADWYVYHAWTNAGDGTAVASQGRSVLIDRIRWRDGWPTIHDGTPSRTPQPVPEATD
jgi:beta-xylosidase